VAALSGVGEDVNVAVGVEVDVLVGDRVLVGSWVTVAATSLEIEVHPTKKLRSENNPRIVIDRRIFISLPPRINFPTYTLKV